MSSRPDRRIHPRIDARVQVQFRSGKEFIDCYSQNISQGGIFIETKVPPDPNAVMEIVLQLPLAIQTEELKQIVLKGRVVRLMSFVENKIHLHKVAVQFIELTPQIQTKLDLLYEELLKMGATILNS